MSVILVKQTIISLYIGSDFVGPQRLVLTMFNCTLRLIKQNIIFCDCVTYSPVTINHEFIWNLMTLSYIHFLLTHTSHCQVSQNPLQSSRQAHKYGDSTEYCTISLELSPEIWHKM